MKAIKCFVLMLVTLFQALFGLGGQLPFRGDVVLDEFSACNGFYSEDAAIDFSGLVGLFEGKRVECADIASGIGADEHMHFADFLTIGGVIWAYYIRWEEHGGQTKGCVGLAQSEDGVHFTDFGGVIHASEHGWDSRMAAFAGAWYEGGKFYVAYEGAGGDKYPGDIGLATSSDGVHFEKAGKDGLLLRHRGCGLEAGNIGTPDLIRVNGTWVLTYHCYDNKTCQICLASGKNLTRLKRYPCNPVIPTRPGGIESGTTGRRDIIYYSGWFYMVYEVSTAAPYDTASWGHRFARSRDLVHWQQAGPVYPATGGGFGNDGPAWCAAGGKLYVYCRADGNTMTRYALAVAE